MTETASTENKGGQGLSITAMVLGILTIFTCIVPFLGVILGILAIIFGIVALKKPGRAKAITGIVTGVIGIVLSIVMIFIVFMVIPVLHKNQRDTAKKADITNIASDVISYSTDNQGRMPSKYELSKAQLAYVLDIQQAAYDGYGYDGNPSPTEDIAVYTVGENCEGEKARRNFSITILLENGLVYCQGS